MEFFNIIRDVIKNSPLNPIHMSVKQWYRHLLEANVTMEKVDDEGRMKAKLCKVEEGEPNSDWQLSYHLGRMKGLSPKIKSFNFKMIHQLLPCKERIGQLLPASSPACILCRTQEPESILHAIFNCELNRDASLYLLNLTKVYDKSITKEKIIKLQLVTDVLYELPTTLVLCTGLELIWRNRHDRRSTRLYDIRAELECLVATLRQSRVRKLREAGNIVKNTLENFPVDHFFV